MQNARRARIRTGFYCYNTSESKKKIVETQAGSASESIASQYG